MTPETFEQTLDVELAGIRALIIERHRKYGPDNITVGGVHGLITRIQDKLARIKQDHKDCPFGGPCVKRDLPDELRDDAWLDLSAYAGPIAMMLLHGTWGLPLEEDTPNRNATIGQEAILSAAAVKRLAFTPSPGCRCLFCRDTKRWSC